MPHSAKDPDPIPVSDNSSQSGKVESEQKEGLPATCDNTNETESQSMDQLSVSIIKLSLNPDKENSSDAATDDLTVQKNGSGDSYCEGQISALPANGEQLTNSEVIVDNQHADDSTINRELQAILQWMAASHLNVPSLTFINEKDNELSKLPELAERAGNKAYTVGDILQEVKRYFVQQHTHPALGNTPPCGLLDWLLANL